MFVAILLVLLAKFAVLVSMSAVLFAISTVCVLLTVTIALICPCIELVGSRYEKVVGVTPLIDHVNVILGIVIPVLSIVHFSVLVPSYI